MKKIYIIKVGTTFPETARELGDFDLWTFNGLGCEAEDAIVVDAEHGEPLPKPDESSGVVVTGSHDMVTDNRPWSVKVAGWIPFLLEKDVPFLGICYGHQLLAHALGGEVGFHPEGTEAGTVDINLLPQCNNDPLFYSLPSTFPAHVTHAQTVLSLPDGAVRLAMNSFEPNHAFRIGKCAWGVQFHPEYDTNIMRSYIINEAEDLKKEGIDVRPVFDSIKETPVAASILKRFYHMAMDSVRQEKEGIEARLLDRVFGCV
jgi:GMP synthase (glutamine-hydrolysing)